VVLPLDVDERPELVDTAAALWTRQGGHGLRTQEAHGHFAADDAPSGRVDLHYLALRVRQVDVDASPVLARPEGRSVGATVVERDSLENAQRIGFRLTAGRATEGLVKLACEKAVRALAPEFHRLLAAVSGDGHVSVVAAIVKELRLREDELD
jgi:hypothetical protein